MGISLLIPKVDMPQHGLNIHSGELQLTCKIVAVEARGYPCIPTYNILNSLIFTVLILMNNEGYFC